MAFPAARFPKDLGCAFPEIVHPDVWNNEAIGLVSDELTVFQLYNPFIKATGKLALTTSGLQGKAVKAGVKQYEVMINWFRDTAYKARWADF